MNTGFNINLSIDDLIKIITVILTTISTYLVAKYNSNTPRNLNVKQLQLEKVYLPIYKILVDDLGYDIERNIAQEYANKIKPILWDSYELVYPQLHKLFRDFYLAAMSHDEYQSKYNEICYQIKIDYNLLKKSLGYPSDSYLGLFFRMSIESKINELVGWVTVLLIFSPITLVFFSNTSFVSENFFKILLINYAILFVIIFLQMPKSRRHN